MILSLRDQPEWGRIYTHPNEEFDLEAVTDEVVGVVRKGLEEHPDIGARGTGVYGSAALLRPHPRRAGHPRVRHQHHDQLRGHGSERVQDVLKYMI